MRTFLALAFLTLPLSAASIVSGGQLLNQTNANQLAAWLGQGDLNFNLVYQPVNGGSAAFHTAVDGRGPTFTIFQTNLGLVGGYDPVSWGSPVNGAYNIDLTDAGRTGFIFNLSTDLMFRQRLTAQANQAGAGDAGQYQTFDYNAYGPAFGGGHDLAVNSSDLMSGYAYSFSYGNGNALSNLFGNTGQTFFTVTRLESYTISAATTSATPEPPTFVLCGAILILLRCLQKRRGAIGGSCSEVCA